MIFLNLSLSSARLIALKLALCVQFNQAALLGSGVYTEYDHACSPRTEYLRRSDRRLRVARVPVAAAVAVAEAAGPVAGP